MICLKGNRETTNQVRKWCGSTITMMQELCDTMGQTTILQTTIFSTNNLQYYWVCVCEVILFPNQDYENRKQSRHFGKILFTSFSFLDQIVIVSRCPFLHCFPFLDLSLSSMSVSENPQQNHNNWSKEMKRNPKLLLRVQWVDLIDSDWDYSNHVAKPTFLGKP